MKDLVKAVVVFGAIYLVWNLFWRGVFLSWDLLGIAGVVLFIVLLRGAFQKVFGEAEPPQRNHEKSLPVAQARSETSPAGTESETETRETIRDLGVESEFQNLVPVGNLMSTGLGDYVQLVSRIKSLEARCARVWEDGLQERRAYREIRRESMVAARQFAEMQREASVPDETLVNDVDEFLDTLCAIYLAADSERRTEIRDLIESHPRLLGNIHNYVGRSAIKLRKFGKSEFLLRGLAGVSIDDDHSHQDYEWTLGELYLAAASVGIDASPYLKIAADASSTAPDGIRCTLETYEHTHHFRKYVQPRLAKED